MFVCVPGNATSAQYCCQHDGSTDAAHTLWLRAMNGGVCAVELCASGTVDYRTSANVISTPNMFKYCASDRKRGAPARAACVCVCVSMG